MAHNQKSYDNEFKAQAVKLAQEIGGHKAANELASQHRSMSPVSINRSKMRASHFQRNGN